MNVKAGELWVFCSDFTSMDASEDECCGVRNLKSLAPIWEGDGVDVLQLSIISLGLIPTSPHGLKHFILKLN